MEFYDMTETSVVNVIGGPSKEELAIALFNQSRLKEPWVTVKTEHGERVMLYIRSVEREDGSDESFNIEATARIPYGPTPGVKVIVYYRTDKRVGKLRLHKQ